MVYLVCKLNRAKVGSFFFNGFYLKKKKLVCSTEDKFDLLPFYLSYVT